VNEIREIRRQSMQIRMVFLLFVGRIVLYTVPRRSTARERALFSLSARRKCADAAWKG
jgi:hypothetical protein